MLLAQRPLSLALFHPDALREVLYLNRSAARLRLRNWLGAEQDGNEALQLAEKAGRAGSWKAYLRRGIGHRQGARSAEADLLRAFQLAPAEMKRKVAAELSLNYAMTKMGLMDSAAEYGLADGRVTHVGHPVHTSNPLAGKRQRTARRPPFATRTAPSARCSLLPLLVASTHPCCCLMSAHESRSAEALRAVQSRRSNAPRARYRPAGLIKYGSFTPLDMIRVRMHQHVEAGPDMDCILGPDACPDPSIWLAKKT